MHMLQAKNDIFTYAYATISVKNYTLNDKFNEYFSFPWLHYFFTCHLTIDCF